MTKLAERRVDPRHLVDAFWIRGFLQSVKKPGDVTPVGVEVGFHMIDFSVDGYRLQVYEPIHAGDTVLVKFEAIENGVISWMLAKMNLRSLGTSLMKITTPSV